VSDLTQDQDLTIDEVARRVGMTVRNVRAYQSRGLVPPPDVRGRTGFYGAEHIARLELIREMQAAGFNLEAIKRMIEGADHVNGPLLGFTRALLTPFADEVPEVIELTELVERLGDDGDPRNLAKAEKLGLLRPLGEGKYEVASPRLQRAAEELRALGVSSERSLAVAGSIRRHAESLSRTFVELFIETIWEPFDKAGRPEDGWPAVLDALERLRPLAAEAIVAMFQLTMTEAVEEGVGRELTREPRGRKRK
jgi:DNA-binding transcriptional MerR regulator